ncbi:pyocin activator PrtN family protein [uncultured Zhongshania sp.]|uniref:pyocin activator PrtN family protein n=1 Tax=uncultured Zhongshania sp. TaxID=1642288 RepID=UPI0030DD42FB
MQTLFLLMAQYNGKAIIPVEQICTDFFSHLTPGVFMRRVAAGELDLPITRMGDNQKAAKGVHLEDLATYLDKQRQKAIAENDKLHGRYQKVS